MRTIVEASWHSGSMCYFLHTCLSSNTPISPLLTLEGDGRQMAPLSEAGRLSVLR